MTQVIVYTNQNGGVSITYPTPDFLQTNTIEDVLAKDCPSGAIIVDDSALPQGDDAKYFDAWVLNNGVVTVDATKKQAIIDAQQAPILAKQSAQTKLTALGLTADEIKALVG